MTSLTMVPAYRIIATGQVVCLSCATESFDTTRSMDAQMVFTRRKAGFTCPGCEAARDMAPGVGDHSPAATTAADRSAIDRTTTHDCAGQAADRAYFAAQGRAMRTCVNCEATIDVHYVQFSHLCKDCRRECTDASDVALEDCAYCGAALDAPIVAEAPLELVDDALRSRSHYTYGTPGAHGQATCRNCDQPFTAHVGKALSCPPQTYACTGRSSATQQACAFTTNDEAAAVAHFEAFDHDLDQLCLSCQPTAYHPSIVSDLPRTPAPGAPAL